MNSALRLLAVILITFGATAQTPLNAAKPMTESQKAFDQLKALSGEWEGIVSADVPMKDLNNKGPEMPFHVTLRTTSRGNALLHEMKQAGGKDDPITMIYLDTDKLSLVHYCDAGNRPRMTGVASPDGKRVEFEFQDITGNMHFGHMHNAAFNFINADHHTEDWTFMMGDKPVHAHFDLHRTTNPPPVIAYNR